MMPATHAVPPRGAAPEEFGPGPSAITGDLWITMAGKPDSTPAPAGTENRSSRFRLAGTFSVEAGDGVVIRKAIVDDTARREQHIAGEGDSVGEATVEKVFLDHITLRTANGMEDLWLDFARPRAVGAAISTNVGSVAQADVATNKFGGAQIMADRWQFRRQALLDYYQALLEEPDRMVAVFDSLKPVRDAGNKITGYVVGIEGEAEFFQAIGLRNGDIVRKVNSLPMTNRRRAEFLIDEFLKDRVNAVVLELERGDQAAKQVYLIRPE